MALFDSLVHSLHNVGNDNSIEEIESMGNEAKLDGIIKMAKEHGHKIYICFHVKPTDYPSSTALREVLNRLVSEKLDIEFADDLYPNHFGFALAIRGNGNGVNITYSFRKDKESNRVYGTKDITIHKVKNIRIAGDDFTYIDKKLYNL